MPKVTNEQIKHSMSRLIILRSKEWYLRFGDDRSPFLGFRRQQIQDQVKQDYDITYSDSGFRGRLKALVEEGLLEDFPMYEGVTFYFYRIQSHPPKQEEA